jgi:hypothetical protein
LTGTPVAGLIFVHPGIQFKSVEGNALFPDGYFNQIRPDFAVEAVPVHANVIGSVT